jgi:ergothioneine biosynthesis protein EgtB
MTIRDMGHRIDDAMPSHDPTLLGVSAAVLRHDLLDARARTLEIVTDLEGDSLMGPRLPIINPILWEIGHLAWFQEYWVLRHHGGESSIRDDADRLYDSMKVAHDTRWDLPLPTRQETLEYMRRVLERILAKLRTDPVDPHLAYFARHVTFHEDMHDEAFLYTRQTLGYSAPNMTFRASRNPRAGHRLPKGDATIPGGTYELGSAPEAEPFVFDNEKWAHPVQLEPFAIARRAVTNGEFAEFVDDGGYKQEHLWTPEGWEWRKTARAEHPVYWERVGLGWEIREFDRWTPLPERLPLIHVNWYEADAYCRWAGRRLPTEAEWEAAAAGPEKRRFPWGDAIDKPEVANLDAARAGVVEADALALGDTPTGIRQLIGNTWEWTASPFQPYPGFTPDPYRDYSKPWFDGNHMVLRGGAWPTRARLLRNTWRNFYPKDRCDVFAGFRTCAL